MPVKRRKSRRTARTMKKVAPRKRSRARKNPARRVNHHLTGAVKLSDRVESVYYRHAKSRTHAPYKHNFGAGVSLYGLADGTVLLKGTKPLWKFFEVEGSE